jgi:dual specificity MAP kinase phosphatase
LPIQDSLTQTILEYLDSSNQFIEEAERVFVHCAAGVNRSPAIVIAYLMKKNLWTYEESFAFVKARRAKANKQSNFMKQLLEYEQTLGI